MDDVSKAPQPLPPSPPPVPPALQDSRLRDALKAACHDIRTPFFAIQLRVDQALQALNAAPDVDRAGLRRTLTRIRDLALTGTHLADTALDQSAPGEDRGDASVEEVLADSIRLHAEVLALARCDVFVERAADGRQLRGHWNERVLRSLLSNLLQNAARYAAGAPIKVTLSRPGPYVLLRIEDGGPGMRSLPEPPKDAPWLADADRSHGLGMWIIEAAVAELRGRIEMRGRSPNGLMVDVWLPAS
jgi:K+-sensing histidine kinase KdpD